LGHGVHGAQVLACCVYLLPARRAVQ